MTVYAIQNPMRKNKSTGALEPRFNNIAQAERWGEIRYLLSPSARPWVEDGSDTLALSPAIMPELRTGLRQFDCDDYLLLIGNPILIGLATAIAAQVNNGRVKFLQWSDGDYVSVDAQGISLVPAYES